MTAAVPMKSLLLGDSKFDNIDDLATFMACPGMPPRVTLTNVNLQRSDMLFECLVLGMRKAWLDPNHFGEWLLQSQELSQVFSELRIAEFCLL